MPEDYEKLNSKRLISVVVPCFNEEEVLDQTLVELERFAADLHSYEVEFVFVDDGSRDATLEILSNAASRNRLIRVLSFARNFGHQIAVTAGIDAASGDAVALIGADLQDPPGVIAEMIRHWEEGIDVVYAVRASREGESAFKVATARWFYRLLSGLSETPIPLDTGDFRLMDRRVVDEFKKMPERHRFVRGMVAWVGFRQMALPYDRKRRAAGTSKYPLRKMLRFAIDGITSFSILPLRLATWLGIMAGLIAIGASGWAVYAAVTNQTVPGWATIMIAVALASSAQLIMTGILGEYVGRIYEEVKRRPLYVVGDTVNLHIENRRNPAADVLDRAVDSSTATALSAASSSSPGSLSAEPADEDDA